MIMSSTKFESLILDFPEISKSIEEIESQANNVESQLTPAYTVDRFFERFSLPSSQASAKLLRRLQEIGVLNKVLQIESRAGGGIEEYSSLLDIPEVLYDFRTDQDFVVEPSDIKVMYQLVTEASDQDING